MDILSLFCFLCILPLFILLFFGVVIGIIYRDRRKHADAWHEAARRAGLTFNEPKWILGRPTLSGDWHGRALRVYTVTRGVPGSAMGGSTSYMRIEMAARLPEGRLISISERDFFSRLGRTGEEIRLGSGGRVAEREYLGRTSRHENDEHVPEHVSGHDPGGRKAHVAAPPVSGRAQDQIADRQAERPRGYGMPAFVDRHPSLVLDSCASG